MGRVKETLPSFQDGNHFGILDHNGVIKVAKTEIRANILHINKDKNGGVIDVLVKGKKGSYVAKIHKGIKNMMIFVDVGKWAKHGLSVSKKIKHKKTKKSKAGTLMKMVTVIGKVFLKELMWND